MVVVEMNILKNLHYTRIHNMTSYIEVCGKQQLKYYTRYMHAYVRKEKGCMKKRKKINGYML